MVVRFVRPVSDVASRARERLLIGDSARPWRLPDIRALRPILGR